jgi:flagellar hook assembly protein FlgD
VGVIFLSVNSDNLQPDNFLLYPNFPNPFNPTTTLRYDLPQNSFVNITIYDLNGREVKKLVRSEQVSGNHSLTWNGTNDQGKLLSAGVYLYQIQSGEFVQTKKMVLMK